jgi:hypothetical protein
MDASWASKDKMRLCSSASRLEEVILQNQVHEARGDVQRQFLEEELAVQ